MAKSFSAITLRISSSLLYALELCCAAVILGVYSYFLSKLSYHDLLIYARWRAVEGVSGAAVLYTLLATGLTWFLGGARIAAIIAVVFNVMFCGAFIALAYLTRDGADSCTGYVETPLGSGRANAFGVGPNPSQPVPQGAGTHLGFACRLNTAAFAVSLVGALLFVLSALLQVVLMRNHQRHKSTDVSTAYNTPQLASQPKRRFWSRKPELTKDANESVV